MNKNEALWKLKNKQIGNAKDPFKTLTGMPIYAQIFKFYVANGVFILSKKKKKTSFSRLIYIYNEKIIFF